MSDSILYWNAVALEANRTSHTAEVGEQKGPPLSARALAIVHLAMYDAYAAANPASGLKPYQASLPPVPTGTTAAGAVAGAAFTALSALFPSQRAFFGEQLSRFPGASSPGFELGQEIANRLLAARAGDPSASDAGYVPAAARGRHRVDPDNPGQGFGAPFFGARAGAFAVTKRFTLDAPPFDDNPATTAEYLTALREVRGRGIAPELLGSVPATLPRRNSDQTVVGIYWGYDGAAGLGTPPRLYNQIVRQLAEARSPGNATQPNSEAENAVLFALVNAAMADAGVLAWDDKFRYDFWRPVLGIREHDRSFGPTASQPTDNPSNDADTGWLPLGAPATNGLRGAMAPKNLPHYPCNQSVPGRVKNFTPNFPAYPSGHATFGAAALHITRLFYGVKPGDRKDDKLFDGLDFISEEFNGVNQDNQGTVRPRHRRSFPGGLWQMIVENGRSRVFLGVHWVFDAFAVDKKGEPDLKRNIGGARLGVDIAEDIFKNGLKQKDAVGPRIP